MGELLEIESKIRLGISTCLLGEKVRYDGGHKLDRFLTSTLGQWVEYVPVCPEVECGLSTPREAMRLEGDPNNPRLVTNKTGRDLTDLMKSWGKSRLAELEKENLCGYIFKSKSPSSGMERIKVYDKNGIPGKTGVGIWARMFTERFPLLPVEDEGRLHDPGLRENFIERIFVMQRWRKMVQGGATAGKLVDFHAGHKYQLMAHSVEGARKLGKIVARGGKTELSDLLDQYFTELCRTMGLKSTIRKNINVMQHMMGYFKKLLCPDEKNELLEIFADYSKEYVPLIVPVTLINHYVRKYDEPYLKCQHYLNPHPIELKLRTHV